MKHWKAIRKKQSYDLNIIMVFFYVYARLKRELENHPSPFFNKMSEFALEPTVVFCIR